MENKKTACADDRFSNLFDDKGRMKILDGMRYYKKTCKQNNMVCSKIVLKEPVDPECLQYAAQVAMGRLRVFRLSVTGDKQFLYLTENMQTPVIHFDDGCLRTVCTPENHGHMTRIGYHGDTITIDFFHGVSDGMGIIAFQKTLLYYYVEKKYGKPNHLPKNVILKDTLEDPREYADSLEFVKDEEIIVPDGTYEYDRAFQLPDEQIESEHMCLQYELLVSAGEFDEYMQKHGSSRSAVFTMFMNRVIAEQNKRKTEPVVAALAVNAREAYGAKETLRCCVATIPVWYDEKIRSLSWSQQLRAGRDMIMEGIRKERILDGAQKLQKFNKVLEEQFPTLEEKRVYAAKVNKQSGTKYTYGFSYLGEVDYGKDINRYIRDSYLILSANTIPVILEIAKWDRHYHISYCTHLKNDPYVGRLRDLFVQEGIPCVCNRKEDFEEAYADF